MKLYHYRSINSALYELRGTFHLSAPQELNDPLESHLIIYWQGDRPAWEGFFKHYVCSYWKSLTMYLLAGEKTDIEKGSLIANIHQFDGLPMQDILNELSNDFLQDNNVSLLIGYLAGGNEKYYTKDMRIILQLLSRRGMYYCLRSLRKYHLADEKEVSNVIDAFHLEQIGFWSRRRDIQGEDSSDFRLILKVAADQEQDILEISYIRNGMKDESFLYKGNISGDTINRQRDWLHATIDFPDNFLNELHEITYPSAYVTCFSANNNDSSMWGNYADCHRGICIEYETNGNGAFDKGETPLSLPVQPVVYSAEKIERNFFTTLGNLTLPAYKAWLSGIDGTLSEAYSVLSNKEQWRQKYWTDVEYNTFHKLPDWAHEEEYRIAVIDTLGEFYDVKQSARNVTFPLERLKGIIFGIRTSEYDKMQIYRAAQENLNLEKVTFYQAEYDDEANKIIIRKKRWN